jgi:hypothetical protein
LTGVVLKESTQRGLDHEGMWFKDILYRWRRNSIKRSYKSRRRENRGNRKWVSVKQKHRKGLCRTKIGVQYFRMCTLVLVETSEYTWVCIRNNNVYLKKHVNMVRITEQTFLGLSAVVFLSVGHYPYYRSPNFSKIKSLSTLVFPLGFFQGYCWCCTWFVRT